MGLIRAAIPIVLGLIVLELMVGAVRRRGVHRLADSIADFGCAAMSQVVGLAVTAVTIGGYAAVADVMSPLRAEVVVTPVLWVIVFLGVDLAHYFVHWLSHRVNVLWACHAVHHSSEEFNYAVGLRNSSFHGFLIWVFFLPAALVGVPWRVVAVCYGLNVLYQFWLHTRLIGRLGPLELVLNTPSHHRVHHGTDPIYLDRNYAGVLIIWDRLFGTFRGEEAEPNYGLVVPLASWNPVWANFHGFALIRDAWRRSSGWRGRFRAVFGRPAELAHGAVAPARPAPSRGVALYAAAHVGLVVAVILGVVLPSSTRALLRLGTAFLVLVTLGAVGGLLDGKPWARRMEAARLATLILAATLVPGEGVVRVGLALVGGLSAVWMGQSTPVRLPAGDGPSFPPGGGPPAGGALSERPAVHPYRRGDAPSRA